LFLQSLGHGEFGGVWAVALQRTREGASGGVVERQVCRDVFLELLDEAQVRHTQVKGGDRRSRR